MTFNTENDMKIILFTVASCIINFYFCRKYNHTFQTAKAPQEALLLLCLGWKTIRLSVFAMRHNNCPLH